MGWTAPKTWVANELVTAALLNTHLRDNLAYLKDAPVFGGDVTLAATKKLFLDGGGDTYLHEYSANSVAFVVAGSDTLLLVSNGVAVMPTDSLWLDGGGNTYLAETSADVLAVVVGGTTAMSMTATVLTLYGAAVSFRGNDTAGAGYRAVAVPNV